MKIVYVNNDGTYLTLNRIYDAEIVELEVLKGHPNIVRYNGRFDIIRVYRISNIPWTGTYHMNCFKPLRQVKLERILK